MLSSVVESISTSPTFCPQPDTSTQRVAHSELPWFAKLVLINETTINKRLDEFEALGLVRKVPNSWQIFLGISRMWHRVVFRSETVGTCGEHSPRPNLRAKIMHWRVARFPFLVAEQAIAPLDFSGLLSSPQRIVKHLLGAHHDRNNFAYDLQLLLTHPEWLKNAFNEANRIKLQQTERSRWLADLCVFEHYHEHLAEALFAAINGQIEMTTTEADDPDTTLTGYLQWCSRQPTSYAETQSLYQQGRYSIDKGVLSPTQATTH